MNETQEALTLRHLEKQWEPRVREVSLLAELEVDRTQIDDALVLLGQTWRGYPANRFYTRVRASYPATFVTALAGAASIYYESGTFWPHVWTATEIRPDQFTPTTWGKLFEECLARLGLTTFPELADEPSMRYVTRILLHAGVPICSLIDWFDCLTKAANQAATDDIEAIFGALHHRAVTSRLYGVDMPVQRFLRFGGDYAHDFIDRSIDLLQGLQGSGEVPPGVGLPQRFVDEAARLVEGGHVETTHRRTSTSTGKRPTLAFDPYGIGVHVLLPSRSSTSPIAWTVSFDGNTSTAIAKTDASGTSAVISLAVPPRVSLVHIETGDERTELRLDTGRPPLLLFGADGRAVPPAGQVPAGIVWAVHPSDSELADAGQHLLERLPSVHRWDGWSASRLDLVSAETIGLTGGRNRAVNRTARPELKGDAVEVIRAVDGTPVHASWPSVLLPPGGSWTVSVTTHAQDISSTTMHAFDTLVQRVVALADLVDGNGGRVDLTVRGALGRGLKTSFLVTEGLVVKSTPSWRPFAENGLAAVDVEILHPNGEHSRVRLGEAEVDARVPIKLLAGSIEAIVRPPAMASQLVSSGRPIQWSHAVRKLVAEEFCEDGGQLVVRHDPNDGAPELVLTDSRGTVLQVVDAIGSWSSGKASYDLRKFCDSVRSNPASHLVLRSSRRHHLVARIQPAKLATDASPRGSGDAIQLHDCVAGVTAGLYQHLEPVAEPFVVTVGDDGVVLLPDELLSAGPLRLVLRVDDPWVPQTWGAFPWGGRNTFDVALPGPREPETVVQKLLLRAELDLDRPGALRHAIRLYPLLDRVVDEERAQSIRATIRHASQDDPGRTLQAIASAATRPADAAYMCINLGIANQPLGHVPQSEIEALLDGWAPLGVLAATQHLRSNDRLWIRDMITDRVGPAFGALLDATDHGALRRPLFSDRALIDVPDEVLDMVFREAGILPSLLLEDDAQALAGRTMLAAIKENGRIIQPIQSEWMNLVGSILAGVLETEAPRRLRDAVTARVEGDGWQSAPAASLALASVARLDVRRPVEDRCFRGHWRFALGRMARCAPDLVGADLVMAEAVLLSEEG